MRYTELNKEGIQKLMDLFYGKVRKDKDLGPIFNGQIGTDDISWDEHKKKIASFWGGIFLGETEYQGMPIYAHLELPPFPREFFNIWLNYFEESCKNIFEEQAAQQLIQRAHIISQRFQFIMYERKGEIF